MLSNKYKLIAVLFIMAGVIYSCSPALYIPSPEQATATVSHEKLMQGRKLYVNTCGSCHSLHLPHEFGAKVWRENVEEMQERAKISDNEKQLILQYLSAAPDKSKKSNSN